MCSVLVKCGTTATPQKKIIISCSFYIAERSVMNEDNLRSKTMHRTKYIIIIQEKKRHSMPAHMHVCVCALMYTSTSHSEVVNISFALWPVLYCTGCEHKQ